MRACVRAASRARRRPGTFTRYPPSQAGTRAAPPLVRAAERDAPSQRRRRGEPTGPPAGAARQGSLVEDELDCRDDPLNLHKEGGSLLNPGEEALRHVRTAADVVLRLMAAPDQWLEIVGGSAGPETRRSRDHGDRRVDEGDKVWAASWELTTTYQAFSPSELVGECGRHAAGARYRGRGTEAPLRRGPRDQIATASRCHEGPRGRAPPRELELLARSRARPGSAGGKSPGLVWVAKASWVPHRGEFSGTHAAKVAAQRCRSRRETVRRSLCTRTTLTQKYTAVMRLKHAGVTCGHHKDEIESEAFCRNAMERWPRSGWCRLPWPVDLQVGPGAPRHKAVSGSAAIFEHRLRLTEQHDNALGENFGSSIRTPRSRSKARARPRRRPR